MGKSFAYFEPLILYVLLFLSGSTARPPAEALIGFSVTAELGRVLLYDLPALALIWYLLARTRIPGDPWIGAPCRRDLVPGLLALPALILIGFIIAVIAPYFGGTGGEMTILRPAAGPGWIVLAVSCLSTGYLEESFFRFYLLARRDQFALGAPAAALVSVAAFSVCHLYEGPWGFLNAALSGAALSFVFLRWRSLHGVALAHGLYNIFVYAISAR